MLDKLMLKGRQTKRMWICESCGHQNPKQAIVCENCGALRNNDEGDSGDNSDSEDLLFDQEYL